MTSLRQFFSKYTGFLRSLKAVYWINNRLNSDKLQHNKALYEKLGIQKSIYSSISYKELHKENNDLPWLDRPNAKDALINHPDYSTFDPDTQAQMIQFIDQGFMVLKGFYDQNAVDNINEEVDILLKKNKTDFNYTGRKVMDAYKISPIIDEGYFRNKRLIKLLNFIMGTKVVPFQTINFIQGSEQRAHSDSIHMTTEPEGYLVAAWTALEDTHEGNGPLFYYPESHRLPFVSCQDYMTGNTKWQIGSNSYKNYEDKIEAILEQQNFVKTPFYAKKGDVFIWHANLLHGGSPIKQPGTTRKSMVAHYFCEDVICYHEISQRPALMEKK